MVLKQEVKLQLNFGCVPLRDPACPFLSKYLSPSHTTYQGGIVGQMGLGVGGRGKVNKAKNAVKIDHTVAGHNHGISKQCIFDVHASRSMGPQTEQK